MADVSNQAVENPKNYKIMLEVHLLKSLFPPFATADERDGGVLYPYVYLIYVLWKWIFTSEVVLNPWHSDIVFRNVYSVEE